MCSPGPARYLTKDGNIGHHSHCGQYVTYPRVKIYTPSKDMVGGGKSGKKKGAGAGKAGLHDSPGPGYFEINRFPHEFTKPKPPKRKPPKSTWCSIP